MQYISQRQKVKGKKLTSRKVVNSVSVRGSCYTTWSFCLERAAKENITRLMWGSNPRP